MESIRDVATATLIKDAARLVKRDPEFKVMLERRVLDYLPTWRRIKGSIAFVFLGFLTESGPVPWTDHELVNELRRRMDLK